MIKKEQPGCIISIAFVIFLPVFILWIYYHWISAIVWLGISACISNFFLQKITGQNAEQIKKDKKLSDRELILAILVFLLPVVIFLFNYLTNPVTFKEFNYEECRKEAIKNVSVTELDSCKRELYNSLKRDRN